ncbi:amidase [Martelella alba]|uniref:Amidase n=1 Tax=Martelella alba TaxID=2590451 RepID=A0A506U6G7_9HYPH|nr:amidase [Martelella alba]TPW29992.1 amidase [Martelella alba]
MSVTVSQLTSKLEAGEISSFELVSSCLERINDKSGEGARVFTALNSEDALETARRVDAARKAGEPLGPLAGIPVSVKCLFDVKGLVTTAGSALLAKEPAATADAPAIARLRAAGAVIIGHTNMTEFAYSGLGMNPHYGTPGNPADRSRVPGGSSSGAAVSVADDMAAIGIGTDTGGSCRIPAAFCGLVGFKPTASRVPTAGAFPLSQTLDSIGSITRSVDDCALTDAIMAGEATSLPDVPALSEMRFAVLDNYVTDDVTPGVAAAFDEAVRALEKAGAKVEHIRIEDLAQLPGLNAHGGIIAAEAFAIHKDYLAERSGEYDPRVSIRIMKAETMEPGEYEHILAVRKAIIARADEITRPYDAVLMPSVAMEAPVTAELDADDAYYGAQNILALRNTTVGNFLDRCGISLPLPVAGLPVGLMLMGETMGDRRLFAVAKKVEQLICR